MTGESPGRAGAKLQWLGRCATTVVRALNDFFLFHHLLRATYVDHGKVHKARFPATTVPPNVPVKMWLPRPPGER